MTTENNPIVDEMIARLRALQGSGEYPPLTRQVLAGEGLEGGGTLADDVTLRLPADTVALLARLGLLDVDDLVTTGDMTEALAGLLRAEHVAPRVFYRDFTVQAAPLAQVAAPLIRADAPLTLTRVTVVVGTVGTQQVRVTVAGQVVTVPAGSESASVSMSVARAAGQTIAVTVGATDAANIVVSLRCEEAGTL